MPRKSFKKYLVGISIGTGIGILSSAALIFMMAAALSAADIPAELISPVTVVLLAFGGFIGGFSSARLSEEKGLICGAFSGILFFLLAWFFGAVFEGPGFGTAAFIKAVMIIIAGSLGGIIGVNYIKRK